MSLNIKVEYGCDHPHTQFANESGYVDHSHDKCDSEEFPSKTENISELFNHLINDVCEFSKDEKGENGKYVRCHILSDLESIAAIYIAVKDKNAKSVIPKAQLNMIRALGDKYNKWVDNIVYT